MLLSLSTLQVFLSLSVGLLFRLDTGIAVSQLVGSDGPFAPKPDGSPSPVQERMERLGLPIVSLKATSVQLIDGEGVVMPQDVVSPDPLA